MDKVELIKHKKPKYSQEKIIAILLFICSGLIWIPFPISGRESAAALICLIIGAYLLLIKQ